MLIPFISAQYQVSASLLIQQGTQVDDSSYKYPAARVLGDSYATFSIGEKGGYLLPLLAVRPLLRPRGRYCTEPPTLTHLIDRLVQWAGFVASRWRRRGSDHETARKTSDITYFIIWP